MSRAGLHDPFTPADVAQSISRRFARQAERHGAQPAIVTRDRTLDYEALGALVRRIARALVELRGAGAEPIAVLLPQDAPLVATILAILGAGKPYVPQDPSHPPDAIVAALRAAGATTLVTEAAHADVARAVAGGASVLTFEEVEASGLDADLDVDVAPDALAYVYFTSGSTGPPKGVADTHRNVLHNVMRYTNSLEVGPNDRLSLVQGPSFSGAVSSLFTALLNGAAVCPWDVATQGVGRALADWVNATGVTIFHAVPAIFRSMLAGAARFPSVRIVRLEGDAASRYDVELFRRHFEPGCRLVNGLGTTETGLCRQYFVGPDTPLPSGALPVGYPVVGMEVIVLDDEGRACGADETGEVAVRSRWLAAGYWRDPERTSRAFVADPAAPDVRLYRTGDLGRVAADGCLVLLGRRDLQLKVRGQWVDVGAVEAALVRRGGVAAAVVATRQAPDGATRLVAWVVPGATPVPSAAALRGALAPEVPAHMIPSAFAVLDALPLDANGKVDRRGLPDPDTGRSPDLPAPVPPRDDLERTLVGVWETVLDVAPIGTDDAFLDLGGDSLSALRIQAVLETDHGLALPAVALAESSTIARIASHLRTGQERARRGAPIVLSRGGAQPPLFCAHDLLGGAFQFAALARRLGAARPVIGLPPFAATIPSLAEAHVTAVRRVQPAGPYHLTGYCFGGVVAFEMAHRLRAAGEEVALLALLFVTAHDFPTLVSTRARRRFRWNVPAKLRLVGRRDRAWLLARLRREAEDLRWRLQRRVEPHRSREDDGFVRSVLADAMRAYRPDPYPGRVALVLGAESTALYTDDPAADWRGLATDGVSVEVLPDDGATMLREPRVAELAARLAGLFD